MAYGAAAETLGDHMGAGEIVCDGVPFGEGPVWCPDGTLVVTSVTEGARYRVWPGQHRASRFADTGGGANGAALAADGSIVVTQNGGLDFGATGIFANPASLAARQRRSPAINS